VWVWGGGGWVFWGGGGGGGVLHAQPGVGVSTLIGTTSTRLQGATASSLGSQPAGGFTTPVCPISNAIPRAARTAPPLPPPFSSSQPQTRSNVISPGAPGSSEKHAWHPNRSSAAASCCAKTEASQGSAGINADSPLITLTRQVPQFAERHAVGRFTPGCRSTASSNRSPRSASKVCPPGCQRTINVGTTHPPMTTGQLADTSLS
jgi:hypothetical protein